MRCDAMQEPSEWIGIASSFSKEIQFRAIPTHISSLVSGPPLRPRTAEGQDGMPRTPSTPRTATGHMHTDSKARRLPTTPMTPAPAPAPHIRRLPYPARPKTACPANPSSNFVIAHVESNSIRVLAATPCRTPKPGSPRLCGPVAAPRRSHNFFCKKQERKKEARKAETIDSQPSPARLARRRGGSWDQSPSTLLLLKFSALPQLQDGDQRCDELTTAGEGDYDCEQRDPNAAAIHARLVSRLVVDNAPSHTRRTVAAAAAARPIKNQNTPKGANLVRRSWAGRGMPRA
ncbi:hypothetical protein CMUS01_12615 [Colletotrichum musicola]|uniref:Uncharacterized protein n=1 Tax=Colletotrichum musicola TaxID=2175873 RepID=A0A8H6JKD5_9PEZI|nr:hypothetical protein CMUS01_12615 [Colletotrichum musicola]